MEFGKKIGKKIKERIEERKRLVKIEKDAERKAIKTRLKQNAIDREEAARKRGAEKGRRKATPLKTRAEKVVKVLGNASETYVKNMEQQRKKEINKMKKKP